jgi:hypothetical protein
MDDKPLTRCYRFFAKFPSFWDVADFETAMFKKFRNCVLLEYGSVCGPNGWVIKFEVVDSGDDIERFLASRHEVISWRLRKTVRPCPDFF